MFRRLLRGLLLGRLKTPRDAARWAFKRHAGKPAFTGADDRVITFAELGERVFTLASGLLEGGLTAGDRVAFALPNSPEFIELRLACHEAGLVAVPLAADLGPAARAEALSACEPKLYVFDPGMDERPPEGMRAVPLSRGGGLDELRGGGTGPCRAEVDPAAPATVNFTSGTTGKPKGVVSTHRAWATSLKMTVGSSLLELGDAELFLHAIPLATAGWGAVLPCLLGGIHGLFMNGWDPAAALGMLESRRVSRTFLTPSMLIDLLDEPGLESERLPALRAIICGTAALHGQKAAETLRRLGPVLFQGYGLAEVLPPLTTLGPEEHDPAGHPLRVGRPANGVRVRVVDDSGVEAAAGARGAVEVASPTQTAGYWRRSDLDAEAFHDGFFRTGDVGFLGPDNYLNVVGRAADRLSSGVSPRDVEEAAHRHPALKECALVEVAGNSVLVCSARRGRDLDAEELRRTLADCPAPDDISILAGDLPRSAAGKVVRRELGR